MDAPFVGGFFIFLFLFLNPIPIFPKHFFQKIFIAIDIFLVMSFETDTKQGLDMISQRFELLLKDYHKLSNYQKKLTKKMSEIDIKSRLSIKNLKIQINDLKQDLKGIDHDLAIIGSWLRFIVKKELLEDIKPKVEEIDVATILQKHTLKDLI